MKVILTEADKKFAKENEMTYREMVIYKLETIEEELIQRDWLKIQDNNTWTPA